MRKAAQLKISDEEKHNSRRADEEKHNLRRPDEEKHDSNEWTSTMYCILIKTVILDIIRYNFYFISLYINVFLLLPEFLLSYW